MQAAIKAIETRYKGYRFRSRLEARYAVFFDYLGIKWEYEKEGYDLDGVLYLPDFWLPEVSYRRTDLHGLWVEIKGIAPSNEEDEKCHRLADTTKHPVFIFQGLPGEYPGESGYEFHNGWDNYMRFMMCYNKYLKQLEASKP